MSKYSLAAMGGTFDIVHKGHTTLFSRAFDIADRVIIGVTSDEFVLKKGKNPINGYDRRLENLTSIISKEFPGAVFTVSKLDDDFGPAVLEPAVDVLVVSDETGSQGAKLNEQRAKKGVPPVDVIIVPMLLAKDGTRISTSRIKNSEIDADGNLLSVDK